MSFFNPTGSKAVVCAFAHTPSLILTGHESGKVALFDAKTGEEVLNNERAHMDVITDLQLSPDRSYFITSSRDKTARVGVVLLPSNMSATGLAYTHFLPYSYTRQRRSRSSRRTKQKRH